MESFGFDPLICAEYDIDLCRIIFIHGLRLYGSSPVIDKHRPTFFQWAKLQYQHAGSVLDAVAKAIVS